jgi:GNAT superfamily N-acetyltransferase
MNIITQATTNNINFETVANILTMVDMASHGEALCAKAFNNSYSVIFLFDNDKLIGFGRAISDGVYQAALYDVALLPSYQGHNLGKLIVNCLLKTVPNFNVILYAAPGKELFYNKFNFKPMKTGMALFTNASKMEEKGFI